MTKRAKCIVRVLLVSTVFLFIRSSSGGKNLKIKMIHQKIILQIKYILFLLLLIVSSSLHSQSIRKNISLNNDWLTIVNDTNKHAFDGFEKTDFEAQNWKKVNVPHNWDQYHGYRRELHGNRYVCMVPQSI